MSPNDLILLIDAVIVFTMTIILTTLVCERLLYRAVHGSVADFNPGDTGSDR